MSVITADDFNFVAALLRKRSAISISSGKEYLVESRLAPVARTTGFKDLSALIAELRRPFPDPSVRDQVVEAMTTNETSFFRDHHPFDALRTVLVPQAMERNERQRKLSVWSAACSGGQELYSLAMLLDTHFPALSAWDINLFGTDLSRSVLVQAREGRYSPLEVNRGLPAPMFVKYLTRVGADYVMVDRLRKWCRFEHMNLADPWPVLPRFDIVFCRNVLIYFELPERKRILEGILRSLARGGCLILGASETTTGLVEGYTPVHIGKTVAYQAGV